MGVTVGGYLQRYLSVFHPLPLTFVYGTVLVLADGRAGDRWGMCCGSVCGLCGGRSS